MREREKKKRKRGGLRKRVRDVKTHEELYNVHIAVLHQRIVLMRSLTDKLQGKVKKVNHEIIDKD